MVSKGNECYRIDSNHFLWTDEMFEGKVKDNINISTNGNQVIAINEETGKKGVARCHPDDDFDFYTGAKNAPNVDRRRQVLAMRPTRKRWI